MLQEIGHVFTGVLAGFDTEDRNGVDGPFKVDILCIDEGLTRHRITIKKAYKEDLEKTITQGTPLKVEALLKWFKGGIGVTFIKALPADWVDNAKVAEKKK